ncbi:MAG: tRNA (N(6)-L-threonylcarbamoyladenosine(37)-C(2))-methylthiotransferase MtaB [Acidobacteriia bacterium]|nr:tRNA (N(6)-L-threonylcarbamoyladenosine(37)-C(2))-methylthiotransferase MtaB [Terriglobia bacterium]
MATFYIEQFGCRATQADAAALERQLREQGCRAVADAASAAVVIVNTCTVTAAADAQARDAIRSIHRRNPAARIIVTGCYAQRAPEDLAALPGVHWVVGNSHKPEIPRLAAGLAPAPQPPAAAPASGGAFLPLAQLLPQRPAQILTGNIFDESRVLAAPVLGGEAGHTRPILKIQDGCNSRCSFCVIPFVRGRSRSLPPAAILDELCNLAAAGYREVVLSGIDLGAYGRDLSPRVEFLALLRQILAATPVERLRVSSIEPLDVTEELIALVASTPRLAQHFHIPLQSGSDRILAAMHRWYRAEHYAMRVQRIHERLPHAALGADLITGFPGESDDDHAATLAFLRALPFTYLHVFSYSPRPGTPAAALPGQLPAAVIKRRARELRALAAEKAAAFRRAHLGRELRVLTLNRAEDAAPGATPAISSNYLRVRVPGAWPSNLWLDVRIAAEEGNCLLAESPAAPTLAAAAPAPLPAQL